MTKNISVNFVLGRMMKDKQGISLNKFCVPMGRGMFCFDKDGIDAQTKAELKAEMKKIEQCEARIQDIVMKHIWRKALAEVEAEEGEE